MKCIFALYSPTWHPVFANLHSAIVMKFSTAYSVTVKYPLPPSHHCTIQIPKSILHSTNTNPERHVILYSIFPWLSYILPISGSWTYIFFYCHYQLYRKVLESMPLLDAQCLFHMTYREWMQNAGWTFIFHAATGVFVVFFVLVSRVKSPVF